MSWTPDNDPYPYGSGQGEQGGNRPPAGPPAGPSSSGPVDQPPWQAGPPPPIPQYSPPPQQTPPPYGAPAQYGQPAYGQPAFGQPEDRVPTAPQHFSQGLPQGLSQGQPRRADWGERAAATLIDLTLVVVPTMVAGAIWDDLGSVVWLVLWGWFAWLNGSKGQSPGKALTGIKVVRDADGSTLGGWVGLIRSAVLWTLSTFSLGLFFVLSVLWPLGDRKKQALHDKIVSATVITGEPKKPFGPQIFRP